MKRTIFYSVIAALIGSFGMTHSYAEEQADIIAKGEEIFMVHCEYCHGKGLQRGGTHRLKLRYQGAVTEFLQDRDNLTPDYIRTMVREWSLGMASIRPSEITDEELDWLIAYLTRNN